MKEREENARKKNWREEKGREGREKIKRTLTK